MAKKSQVIFSRRWKLGWLLFLWPFFLAKADGLQIAVAANVQDPFKEIANVFQAKTGISIEYVIGSTGKFVTQIMHGAPFDILLSADMTYPTKLYQMHLTVSKPKPYVDGQLILWTTYHFDLKKWSNLLQSSQIKRIAIAHPNFAPLGKEALSVLKKSHLLEKINHKLVYGDSIAQTNQYIATGHADVGFTAQSIVFNPQFSKIGKWIMIPQSFYRPIKQGVVILKSTHHLDFARRFIEFLYSPMAQAIFKRYGYRTYAK